MESPGNCPICFEELQGRETASPDVCDHVFCLFCLQKWTKQASFCPVDRKRFRKIIDLSTFAPIQVKPRKRKRQKVLYDVSVYCDVCNKSTGGDTLILCDCCDLGYHLSCLTPKLNTVPPGVWHCPVCVAIGEKLKAKKGITKEVELIARMHTNLHESPSSSSSESNQDNVCSPRKNLKSESISSSSFPQSTQHEKSNLQENTSKEELTSYCSSRLRRNRIDPRKNDSNKSSSETIRSLRPRQYNAKQYCYSSESSHEEDSSSENSNQHYHFDSSSNNDSKTRRAKSVESVCGTFTQKNSNKLIVLNIFEDSNSNEKYSTLRGTNSKNTCDNNCNKFSCSTETIKNWSTEPVNSKFKLTKFTESLPMDLTNHGKKSIDDGHETKESDVQIPTLTKYTGIPLESDIGEDLGVVAPCINENSVSLKISNDLCNSSVKELPNSGLKLPNSALNMFKNKETEMDVSNNSIENVNLGIVSEVHALNSSEVIVAEKIAKSISAISEVSVCEEEEQEPFFDFLDSKTSSFCSNKIAKGNHSSQKIPEEQTLFSVFEKNGNENSFLNKYSVINQTINNTTYQARHNKDVSLLPNKTCKLVPCTSCCQGVNAKKKSNSQKTKELDKLEKEKWKTYHKHSEKSNKLSHQQQCYKNHCKNDCKRNNSASVSKYFQQRKWSENYEKLLSIAKKGINGKNKKWDQFDTVILNNSRRKFYCNRNYAENAYIPTTSVSSKKSSSEELQSDMISMDQKTFLSLEKNKKKLLHAVYCLSSTTNLAMRNDGSIFVDWQ